MASSIWCPSSSLTLWSSPSCPMILAICLFLGTRPLTVLSMVPLALAVETNPSTPAVVVQALAPSPYTTSVKILRPARYLQWPINVKFAKPGMMVKRGPIGASCRSPGKGVKGAITVSSIFTSHLFLIPLLAHFPPCTPIFPCPVPPPHFPFPSRVPLILHIFHRQQPEMHPRRSTSLGPCPKYTTQNPQ